MMLVIGSALLYVAFGVLAGVGLSTYGKIKRWDETNRQFFSVIGGMLWPLVPFAIVLFWIVLVPVAMAFAKVAEFLGNFSDYLADKYR